MDNTVYYNRGLLNAAIEVEALRNALVLTHGGQPTGTDVKKGMEEIHDFNLGGLVPPLQITSTDHEGGGWVRIFRVKGEGLVPVTDWFNAYRDVVWQQVKAAEQTQ
jgi:branched-chain amino acid transport system substrate-binding protein